MLRVNRKGPYRDLCMKEANPGMFLPLFLKHSDWSSGDLTQNQVLWGEEGLGPLVFALLRPQLGSAPSSGHPGRSNTGISERV